MRFTNLTNRSTALKIQDILPVVASVVIIVLVAVVEKQSKFAAAITAVMPIGATLSLWIVYTANDGDRQALADFGQGLVLGILPTLGFLLVVWLATRSGWKLLPMLLLGYAVWGVGVGLTLFLRRVLVV
jgi:uncharacterized membrane protein (GlpM family)